MNRKSRRAAAKASGNKLPAVGTAFAKADADHRAGRLRDALRGYGAVPPGRPEYVESLRRAGLIALQLAEYPLAVDNLSRALAQLPGDAGLHYNLGLAHKEFGDLQNAADSFRRAADLDPADVAAIGNLGSTYLSLGDNGAATTAFQQALVCQPNNVTVLVNLGLAQQAAGSDDDAEATFRHALALAPSHRDARMNLGAVLRRQGRLAEAIQAFTDILRDRPEDALALTNLGATLLALGQHDEAADTFLRLTAATPGDAAAHYALGNALYDLGRLHESAAAFQQALHLRPGFGEAWDNLGLAQQATGQSDEAIRAHRRAAALMPEDAACRFNLGTALQAAGQPGEARLAYEDCLQLEPANAGARYLLAALKGETPAMAPTTYVESLFDSYARWFDGHLVDGLGYRTPEALRALCDRIDDRKEPYGQVLDLGCGTGLVGKAFRDKAAHLTGVDLSMRMIDEARRKGIYDTLAVGDLVAFLKADAAAYDLVLAGDVLVYIGNLEPLFAAIAERMAPSTLLLFSVEHLADGRFQLTPSGRYAHSEPYITELAATHGFRVRAVERTDLRHDQHLAVAGLIFALCRAER